jgi:4-amino-4-deoxy-L-arabinose transferase-like glycosyltransferase
MGKFILPLVLFIGFVFRVLWIDKYPVGFTPDEASFGYDAYSILKTGGDQWGHTFPMILESFGDYKSPLYSYLSIPSVTILGLTKFAVRLPNAVLGTLAIYLVYLLTFELRTLLPKKTEIRNSKLEVFSAFLLAISPWHIMMSRGAFEANLTTFFIPLGMYLLFHGLRTRSNLHFIFAFASFGLNLLTYHSAKFVTPLVLSTFILFYKSELNKIDIKTKTTSLVIFIIFFGMTLLTLLNGGASRAKDINIFNGTLVAAAEERIKIIDQGVNPFFAKILHNKYQLSAERFISNYSQYFSYKFLFSDGPAETTYGMMPGTGVLYLVEIILLFGFVLHFAKNLYNKNIWLLLVWLIIAPIPAALSTGPGYAGNRSVIMLPALQIIMAFGFFEIVNILSNRSTVISRWFKLSFISLEILLLMIFVGQYIYVSPIRTAKGMLYGRSEVAKMFNDTESNQKIIVSTSLSEPHIYFAFENSWDPAVYQKEVEAWNYKNNGLKWVDQMSEYRLGQYTFKKLDYKTDITNSVVVGLPEDFPKDVVPDKIVRYPDGSPAIYIFEPKKMNYAQSN